MGSYELSKLFLLFFIYNTNRPFVIMKLIHLAASKHLCLSLSACGERIATNVVDDDDQWIKVMRTLISPELVYTSLCSFFVLLVNGMLQV